MVIKRFPGRTIELVMDGAYPSQAWRNPPERVTVTPRMRGNAALHKLPAASRKPEQMGRTPLKGAKTPHPRRDCQHRALQENHRHQPGRTSAHRAHPRVRLPLVQAVLHPAGQRDPDPHPGTTDGFDVALASTDIDATPQLLARYDTRWTIETCNQEAKAHGVGDARNRVERAVKRTVPFGFLAQTITIAWYAVHGNPEADLDQRLRQSPW